MKNKVRTGIVLGVIFVVYTVLTFTLPFTKNAVLWVSYLFGVVAIAAQLYVMRAAFEKETTVKSKFYGFPIANLGVLYMAVQLMLGLVFMVLAAIVPLWLPLVLYVLLLGATVIGFVAADTMRDEVEQQDVKLKCNTSTMRSLRSRANALAGQCEQEALAAVVRKLAEDLNYSDPISGDTLTEQERQLSTLMDELERAVTDKEIDAALALCKRMTAALIERNRLCKLNKQ